MLKTLLVSFIAFSFFTGCTTTKYVYVKDSCPSIKVIKTVDNISGRVDDNGCICNDQLKELLQGASQLRQSETYYSTQVTKYNNEFAIPKEGLDTK